MGDWLSFLQVLPSVAAVANGVLAVLIAQFFPGRPRIKGALAVLAFMFAAAAIGITLYGQYLIVHERAAERAVILDTRDRLGEFIAEGNELMRICTNRDAPVPIERANKWVVLVESFLTSRLGKSYVIRFRDATGTLSISLPGSDSAHESMWYNIYTRVLRLEQFSGEIAR